MMGENSEKPVRRGQAYKRAAILTAARELLVHAGVERTSMDAIAARADVSKRTVYDYYGDKRRLLRAVIEDAGEKALATWQRLIEQHLSDDAVDRTRGGLDRVLTSFAAELGRSQLESPHYAAAVKLIAENEPLLPELEDHPLDQAHVEVLAERFASFGRSGLLDVDDPRLAADHFSALTTLRVLNEPLRRRRDLQHVEHVMTDGARAFMRAYATRNPA